MSKWTIDKATDTFQAIVAIIAMALTVYVLSSCGQPTLFDDDYIRNPAMQKARAAIAKAKGDQP